MGITTPNLPAEPSERTDFDSTISVLSPSGDAPTGGPDASLLSRADFPAKELPPVIGIRDSRFQTVFKQSVLDDIHDHGKSSMEAEVCGVLIGDIYCDRLAAWGYVEHSIRGNNAVGKQTQVTITSETWTRIHETLEAKYPGKKIIGWYHTHPGFGIFLSGMDLFIQDNFFNQPWQFATVYDPHSGDLGNFIWRQGKSQRENILIENDIVVSNDHNDADALDAVDKLTKRVAKLERRVDVLLTGLLLLVLLALIAPLALVALAPDAIRRLPLMRQPAATSPAGKGAAGDANPDAPTPVVSGSHGDLIFAKPDPTDDPFIGTHILPTRPVNGR
jgi:proteasome lid subunit RPN8/RPN11